MITKLIASRVPPGDRWKLLQDPKETIIEGITNTLNEYMYLTGYKGDYLLSPNKGTLSTIENEDDKDFIKNIKNNFYGE